MDRQTQSQFNNTTPVTNFPGMNLNNIEDEERNARFQQKISMLQKGAGDFNVSYRIID